MSTDNILAIVETYLRCSDGNSPLAAFTAREAVRTALEELQRNAYADGRKDEAEGYAWQSIETAPIDERIMIAATPDWVCEGIVFTDTDSDDNGREVRTYHWADGCTLHPNHKATHWMPLPKHPHEA